MANDAMGFPAKRFLPGRVSRARASTVVTFALVLLGSRPYPSLSQGYPDAFQLEITVGGWHPTAGTVTVRIADSVGTFYRISTHDLTASPLDSLTFPVSPDGLDTLWAVISRIDFFLIEPVNISDFAQDGSYAQVLVVANADSHFVESRNTAVPGFDQLISSVNDLTPESYDLGYHHTEPFEFTLQPVCSQRGKASFNGLNKSTGTSGERSSLSLQTTSDTEPLADAAHPGTAIGCPIPLRDAVARGVAAVSAKGGDWGDQMAILVDNSEPFECEEILVQLYLDLWGPGASLSTASEIEEAIEQTWGNMTTSDGKPFNVDVIKRVSPDAESAPGSPGYHQIKLVPDSTFRSLVSHNETQGVKTGTWSTAGSHREKTWAHEAGHLLGLPDRYEEYTKTKGATAQEDSEWRRKSDAEIITSTQVAEEVYDRLHSFLGLSRIEIIQLLDMPSRKTYEISWTGQRRDIMAGLFIGAPQQEDIDSIAEMAGLIVGVRPGDVFVSPQDHEQNFVATRSEDVFAPSGELKYLGGLWASCIDRLESPPERDRAFDIAPPLWEWSGIEAASVLQQLLDFINENEEFCIHVPAIPKFAVWRITDNLLPPYECRLCRRAETDAFLEEAGLTLGDQLLDFPRLSNPTLADSSSSSVVPDQLFRHTVDVAPGAVVSPGELVSLSAANHAPTSWQGTSMISWMLERPTGSTASLSNNDGLLSTFEADERGFYLVETISLVYKTPTDTLQFETSTPITAADDFTETFEDGALESNGPFYWTMTGEPWFVTDTDRYTGTFSVASPEIETGDSTAISIRFNQASEAPISFALKLRSSTFDQFTFAVDDNVLLNLDRRVLIPSEFSWKTFTADLAPGEHVAVWTFYQRSGLDGVISEPDRAWIDDVFFPQSSVFVAIDGSGGEVPARYSLSQNYPNPFNPTTTVSYSLPETADVTMTVYDLLGRQIRELASGTMPAGTYAVTFDAGGLPSGIYFYRLQAGDYVETKRMVVVK